MRNCTNAWPVRLLTSALVLSPVWAPSVAHAEAVQSKPADPPETSTPADTPKPAEALKPADAPPNAVEAEPVPAPAPAATSTEPPPPPVISVEQPPPPPPVKRTFHVHDGFYTRVDLGFGSVRATVSSPYSDVDHSGNADSLGFDLMVGGSPSPGVAVGGALMLDSGVSATFDTEVGRIESDVGTALLGAFIDGFPNARKGFHLGGALGLVSARLSTRNVAGFRNSHGVGLSAWAGYDAWVADEWSLGGLLRLNGTRTQADVDGHSETMGTGSVELMLTALYN